MSGAAHTAKEKIEVEESGGNVFKDLGHPNPDEAPLPCQQS
jgi:hypothetical protein